jgi:hypothetical protein
LREGIGILGEEKAGHLRYNWCIRQDSNLQSPDPKSVNTLNYKGILCDFQGKVKGAVPCCPVLTESHGVMVA